MSTQNLVSAVLAPADKASIQTAIQTINTKLPFLISLTPEERRMGTKLGDKSIGFMDKAFFYAQNNASLVPAFVNIPEALKDYNVQKDLNDIQQWLTSLLQKIEDTRLEAGVEAFSSMLSFYQAVKLAAAKDVPGARAIYEDLQLRFPGKKHNAQATPAPSNP